MNTPEKTPMKCVNFLSPSGYDISFVCQCKFKEKINIWKEKQPTVILLI